LQCATISDIFPPPLLSLQITIIAEALSFNHQKNKIKQQFLNKSREILEAVRGC
jgi:hypothetical protein